MYVAFAGTHLVELVRTYFRHELDLGGPFAEHRLGSFLGHAFFSGGRFSPSPPRSDKHGGRRRRRPASSRSTQTLLTPNLNSPCHETLTVTPKCSPGPWVQPRNELHERSEVNGLESRETIAAMLEPQSSLFLQRLGPELQGAALEWVLLRLGWRAGSGLGGGAGAQHVLWGLGVSGNRALSLCVGKETQPIQATAG